MKKEFIHSLKEEFHEDLIPKDEYIHFLNKILKKKSITECQYKTLKKYYFAREFNYPNHASNKMIYTYFQHMKKDKRMYLFIRFYILLIHFISSESVFEIINKFKNTPNFTDKDVLDYMMKMDKKKFQAELFKEESNRDLCDSKEYLYSLLFNKFIKILKDPKHHIKYQPIYNDLVKHKDTNFKYLDIGCGNGKKTKIIANIFKIPMKNVYCTDIPSWGPYEKNRKSLFHLNHFQPINPNTGILNFPDNYFDFVSVILTLHHIPNITKTLTEIKRILKPDGILLIIEHDALTKNDHLIIDIQHMLYSYLRDKKSNPEWKNYISTPTTNRYMNIMEWTFLIEKYKFQYLYGQLVYEDLSHQLAFDNQFYGFWKNTK